MQKERKAQWGERMIELKTYLWTNNIARGNGSIRPGHAWGSGVVRIEKNEAHLIRPRNVKFNSLMELPRAVEKLLIQSRVKIHPSREMKKYLMSSKKRGLI